MARYVLGRLLQAVATLLAISFLAFLITRLVPGDPARIILGIHVTPRGLTALHHALGLDKPLLTQYGQFLSGLVHLHFGQSIAAHGQSVGTLLAPRVGPTLWLTLYACLLAVLVAVPLGMLAATRRNRLADHAVRLASTLGYATPAFLTGLLLVLVFSVRLHIAPVSGYQTGFIGGLKSLTLPAITVALTLTPLLIRTLRAGLLDTLSSDFIEAARARGLSGRRVLLKHALRNSILPALTILGVSFGTLLSADVIVENVFSIPGLGSLLVGSVNTRDYPVVQAVVVLFAGAVVLSSLAVDLLYFAVDPRIRR